jgi:AraC-like DNA-binding protein
MHLNISTPVYGELPFHPTIPEGLRDLKIHNSHPFHSVGPYGNVFYQEVEARQYRFWQILYRPAEKLLIHSQRDGAWLGFRLLLKKHIRHILDTGTKLYIQQGQFNFLFTPVAASTFELEKDSDYLIFDMYTKPSLLKNLKLNMKLLDDFLERAEGGRTEFLVKGSAWGHIGLLDAVTDFFKYPLDESLANEVVKRAIQAAANDRQRVQLPEERIEGLFAVRESIKKNIQKHIRITDLARKAGMNRQYFQDGFKQVFGKTPFQYLDYERVKAAKLLLKNPQQRIQSIARQVGIKDPSTFTRMFTQLEGMSPTKWSKANC